MDVFLSIVAILEDSDVKFPFVESRTEDDADVGEF